MNDSPQLHVASSPVTDGTPRSATIVTRVELHVFAFPIEHRHALGTHLTNRTRVAVRVHTADGAVGEYVGGNEMLISQAKVCGRKLVGYGCFERELYFDAMKRDLRKNDKMGISPFDIALWDLAGKRAGQSVSQMLGGWRTPAAGVREHLVRRRAHRAPELGLGVLREFLA